MRRARSPLRRKHVARRVEESAAIDASRSGRCCPGQIPSERELDPKPEAACQVYKDWIWPEQSYLFCGRCWVCMGLSLDFKAKQWLTGMQWSALHPPQEAQRHDHKSCGTSSGSRVSSAAGSRQGRRVSGAKGVRVVHGSFRHWHGVLCE